ncbi:alpha/beta-hydrolase [Vararia minispora EC-137]|uniref:Alpha/beta-hydrolase n=1 Tax=Vararia minispora EC-137 TaxID=1314806 RepID=A0ACB8QRK8_9AGAM|nr:alpha/beta-hydrolase [Vararia minispora EC-137]
MSWTPVVKLLTSKDGTTVYADAIGDPSKPHVVFIHGASLSGAVFDHIFQDPRYQSQLYLVRYDMRGHGRTGKPETEEGYVSERYAEDFMTVVEAFGIKEPVLIGWSMGGTVAADVTQHCPDFKLSGIVYLAALAYVGPIMSVVATPGILSLLSSLTSNDDCAMLVKAKLTFADQLFVKPETVPYELKCKWLGITVAQPPQALRLICTRTQDPAGLFKKGNEGLPLLIVHGTEDEQIVAEKVIEEAKPVFKNITVRLFNGLGHALFYEDPEGVMASILDFVRQVNQKTPWTERNPVEA